LILSQLLYLKGIDSVILERRSQAHVQSRIRAGVLEQGTVELLDAAQVGERLRQNGLRREGIKLAFNGQVGRIDLRSLTGSNIVIYDQTELTKDLIDVRLRSGGQLFYEVDGVRIHDFDMQRPSITYTYLGNEHRLYCDYIVGCDGDHGICRQRIPEAAIEVYTRDPNMGWLGILSETPPVSNELIYAHHERGFALCSMRSHTRSRCYIQCAVNDDPAAWTDVRFWDELRSRLPRDLAESLITGPSIEKSVVPLRSRVVEPMRFGRLFLAGDAAHIMPPTGAKGLNLAASDVCVLAEGLSRFYAEKDCTLLDRYSDLCLRRVWKAMQFSWWLTSITHRVGKDPFRQRLQLAALDGVLSSEAASTCLAENYVGLPSMAY
jgi:p-hydroxybenzoate 3-monooxygenase